MSTSGFAPKCIWCSAPWSDENVKVYDFDAADQCESGRFGPEEVTVSIVCHACNRLMYTTRAENDYGGAWKYERDSDGNPTGGDA